MNNNKNELAPRDHSPALDLVKDGLMRCEPPWCYSLCLYLLSFAPFHVQFSSLWTFCGRRWTRWNSDNGAKRRHATQLPQALI